MQKFKFLLFEKGRFSNGKSTFIQLDELASKFYQQARSGRTYYLLPSSFF